MWVRWLLMFVAAAALTDNFAWALGEILGESKEELKLEYDVSVHDHGTGRVTVVFTLADEGRLKPLDAVELCVPSAEKAKDGGRFMDLAVSLDLKHEDGKRVARVHLLKELAERAEIWLTTSHLDGKAEARTRFHHVIPIAHYLKDTSSKPRGSP